jgi:hypothetical protein
MTKTQATAEVFWTAFKALPKEEREEVLAKIIKDKRTRHDLMDLALMEDRKTEPSRAFREYLEESKFVQKK